MILKYLIVLHLSLLSSMALACKCAPPNFEGSYDKANYVAYGEIVKIDERKDKYGNIILVGTFKELESYKGQKPLGLEVHSKNYSAAANCARKLIKYNQYVVFANSNVVRYSSCSDTKDLSKMKIDKAHGILQQLRQYSATNEQPL
jgi:hypothetical protein